MVSDSEDGEGGPKNDEPSAAPEKTDGYGIASEKVCYILRLPACRTHCPMADLDSRGLRLNEGPSISYR